VRTVGPKLSPLIVTIELPEIAALRTALLEAGASNEKIATDVPTTPFTVNIALRSNSNGDADTQVTAVGDDHAVVLQGLAPSADVAVRTVGPKLSPLIVTLVPPVTAPFRKALLTTGTSNVKIVMDDPTVFATLTITPPLLTTVGAIKHSAVVADVHDVVVHTFREIDDVAVSS